MTPRLLHRLLVPPADRDRGDVPGWVLITLMTAMLVVVLMAVAQDRLVDLFNRAMDSFN